VLKINAPSINSMAEGAIRKMATNDILGEALEANSFALC
jgi:hypothetical protein